MLSPSSSSPPFEPRDEAGTSTPKRTLLIVDDEKGIRDILSLLFRTDYNILLAEGGVKAIELATQHPIDAAVLDISMDDMSGIKVLARLKALNPAIEVVMCTAYQTLETAQQAMRLGARDYLTKPFQISVMVAAVAKAMERRAMSDEMLKSNQQLKLLRTTN